MIKGWRNNPKWVQYYERKASEKIEREINRARNNADIKWASMEADERIRNLAFPFKGF